jgi:hypothetical protein
MKTNKCFTNKIDFFHLTRSFISSNYSDCVQCLADGDYFCRENDCVRRHLFVVVVVKQNIFLLI